MDWMTLGIEPTKDKKSITAAYRQKLRETNPEDKPEEFKALRAAYEEAMALADRDESDEARDESPVGLWMEAVSAVYQNYAARIDPEKWEALLRSDVCVALDTRAAAEEALLRFLMEHYLLPQNVWKVLDETFRFSERVEELYESWPQEFVDHGIMSGLRLEPSLDYELFIPGVSGADCDAYRRLFFQANQTAAEDLGPILEQMDGLSERHPYGEVLRCRYYLATDRAEEGRAGLRKLAQDHADHASLTLLWAELCVEDGNVSEAEQIAERILERMPEHPGAKNVLARCLAQKGRYHEAKELAYELMHGCGGDPITMNHLADQMREWNEQLICQREARYAEAADDADNAIELAWCYAQNERLDEAMELAVKIDPQNADAFAYYNLMGKLHHNSGNFEEALRHLQTVEEIIRGLQPDGTAKTEKRIRRLNEMLQIQGSCLMQLGRTEDARRKLEEALAITPEDPEVLTVMGKILYTTGDYSYAAEILERLLRVKPGAWYSELLLALTLYKLHRDREAFDAVNRALSVQSNDLSLYIIKMQILIRNSVFEEVHTILNFLQENGAPEDISTDFIKAQLTELEQKDTKNALRAYQAIADRVESGESMIWTSELYYHLAVLTGNQMDVSREENRNTVIALIDKGLAHDAFDTDCLAYKAWVLKRGGRNQEAIEMYRTLEQKQPDSPVALKGLADLYYEDLTRNAADALTYYERLLEKQKTAELYFYAATCKRYLGDKEGARIYYLRELEMDPDDVDGYRGLALICDTEGQYAKSLELLDQALSIMETYERRYDWLIEHKTKVLRRMGRVDEALGFVDEAMERYQYAGGFQLKFDICCQFGLWEQGKQVLDEWKKASRNDPDQMAAVGKRHLLMGKMFQAAITMGAAKRKLPHKQVLEFRLQLANLECNLARQIQIWSYRVRQNPKDDHALMNLAQAYWYAGKKDAAQGAAQRALDILDETLSRNLTEEALYRGRRSLVLAILGRGDEAKAELTRTRGLPLCGFCEYCSCKDADIYEAAIAEILGDQEQAYRLYKTGRANWPDELDFAAGEARLKRKGIKEC